MLGNSLSTYGLQGRMILSVIISELVLTLIINVYDIDNEHKI